jgi:hypothetical protein
LANIHQTASHGTTKDRLFCHVYSQEILELLFFQVRVLIAQAL